MRSFLILTVALMAGCGVSPTVNAPLQPNIAVETVEALRAHPIEDVLGIGPVYAKKLKEAGIKNTDQLLAAAKTRTQRHDLADDTGIPYGNVLHIARKVELMRIRGIGIRQSNLLEAVGVDSVKELAQRSPLNLWDRMMIANNISRPFVGVNPSKTSVARWVEEAKTLNSTSQALED